MIQSNLTQPLALYENKLSKQTTNIHKFGGSSLANAASIKRVVSIIAKHCQLNDIIVVSANGDTTDRLFSLLQLASKNEAKITEKLQQLAQQQTTLINTLLSEKKATILLDQLQKDIQQIENGLLLTETNKNDILAFGELWSARLLSTLLNTQLCPSYYLDARDFLSINNAKDYEVDNIRSQAKFCLLKENNKLTIITGYIAKDEQGKTCTLGRNGSDYSASIMAVLGQAKNITLWTDVDGIYSADPRIVPNARKLHRLPNEVAKELGRLGNPILHANTLKPLAKQAINLHVASSFDAQITGTEIGDFGLIAKQALSVTYLNDLIKVESTALVGIKAQQAELLFNCVCINKTQGFVIIRQDQQQAISQWLDDSHIYCQPCAIVAVVGYQVANRGNIKARFKRALKNTHPVSFIEQEVQHSIIAVLNDQCTVEQLNNIHHQVTKEAKQIGLVIAGLGNIGQRFLALLPEQLTRIPALENAHLVALLSSSKMLINDDGIDAKQALNLFTQNAQNYQVNDFLQWLKSHPYDELVVIDITPSEAFSQLYLDFFQQGVHVIGANKWAASSSQHRYSQLIRIVKKQQCLWLGNTTVGAGLPINYVIKDLRNSGDQITEISGIFSGTLSWLFEKYDGSIAFSQLLLEALAQGITEPDPREDLSGRDVQRKLLILARLAGFDLSLDDINCENLVPNSLQQLDKAEFLSRANELDDFFAKRLNDATTQNACIRYIAKFAMKNNQLFAEVKLAVLAQDHAFVKLTPCDNIFQIKSQWYQNNPLIIRGPGAGRDVTAGGLHSDLVSICQQLASKKTPVTIKGINK